MLLTILTVTRWVDVRKEAFIVFKSRPPVHKKVRPTDRELRSTPQLRS